MELVPLEERETDPNWFVPVLGHAAGCRWMVVPMLYNVRLIGVPEEQLLEGCAAYGWCYRPGAAAELALRAWDPVTQDEPMGWHKRAGDVRWAPERDRDVVYNRARCVHGTYLDADACGVADVCPETGKGGGGS